MTNLPKLEDAILAGYFDLELALVPQMWFERQDKPIRVGPDDYRAPPIIWWDGGTLAKPVHKYCDLHFENTGPSSTFMREELVQDGWTDADSHRIDLIANPSGNILDLVGAIDIRQPYSDFVDQLIVLALKVDCLFYDYSDDLFFEPSRAPILKAIETHTMAHVSFDDAGRLLPH